MYNTLIELLLCLKKTEDFKLLNYIEQSHRLIITFNKKVILDIDTTENESYKKRKNQIAINVFKELLIAKITNKYNDNL